MDINNKGLEYTAEQYGRVFIDGVSQSTSDPAVYKIWRDKTSRIGKLDIIEQMAVACGYGIKLVNYWLKTNPKTSTQSTEFFEACGECFKEDLTGWFLAGTVLEDWYASDWRGQKAQRPSPHQLFERALMVHGRLQQELLASQHAVPTIKRISTIDELPSLY